MNAIRFALLVLIATSFAPGPVHANSSDFYCIARPRRLQDGSEGSLALCKDQSRPVPCVQSSTGDCHIWHLEPVSSVPSPFFTLHDGHRAVGVQGGELEVAMKDQVTPDNTNFQWYFKPSANGHALKFVNRGSKLALDGTDDARVHARELNNGDVQDWWLP